MQVIILAGQPTPIGSNLKQREDSLESPLDSPSPKNKL